MNVNFIMPHSDDLAPVVLAVQKQAMPVVPTYLAALTPEDVNIKLTDMLGGDEVDYNEPYDLVAITVRTPLADVAYQVADEFRQKGTPVVLGGPHATALPLEASQHANAVAIGEAENTWKVLLQDSQEGQLKQFYVGGPFDTANLPGTVYHDPERPSLNGLPHLRRDLLPSKRYRMDSIFTSRGCPFGCKFCNVIFLHGPKVRHRPVEEVVAEVDTLKSMYFNMDDSALPAYDQQYYLDLYGELAELKPKRSWIGAGSLNAAIQPMGRQLLKRAAESGLVMVGAGIESLDEGGLLQSEAWRKLGVSSVENYNLEQTKEAIRVVQDAGILIMGFFVVGFDQDTPDVFEHTLEFCDEMGLWPIIQILTPIPGTAQYSEFENAGRLLPVSKYALFDCQSLLFQHPNFEADQMERMLTEIMKEGYSMGRILRRVWRDFRRQPSFTLVMFSLFTQLAIRQAARAGATSD